MQKKVPRDMRAEEDAKRAYRLLRLKGWERRRMRERIERWLEECQLDMCVDKDQMWRDMIMIRGHSADCLPIAMINMVTGWELFVHADGALGEQETSLFNSMFNATTDPPK
jgi:hypothetical protein